MGSARRWCSADPRSEPPAAPSAAGRSGPARSGPAGDDPALGRPARADPGGPAWSAAPAPAGPGSSRPTAAGRASSGSPCEQLLGRDQVGQVGLAARAVAGVPGDPLAPQRAGRAVPVRGDLGQLAARRPGVQRADDQPGRGEPLLHPADPHRRVGGRQAQARGDRAAVEHAGRLLPPQRQQLPVLAVQPAGGLGRLPALAREAEPHDGQVHEVGAGVGHLGCPVAGQLQAAGRYVVADLADGDGHQPRAERGRVAHVADGRARRAASSPARRRPRPRGRSAPGRRCCRAAAGTGPAARPARPGHLAGGDDQLGVGVAVSDRSHRTSPRVRSVPLHSGDGGGPAR